MTSGVEIASRVPRGTARPGRPASPRCAGSSSVRQCPRSTRDRRVERDVYLVGQIAERGRLARRVAFRSAPSSWALSCPLMRTGGGGRWIVHGTSILASQRLERYGSGTGHGMAGCLAQAPFTARPAGSLPRARRRCARFRGWPAGRGQPWQFSPSAGSSPVPSGLPASTARSTRATPTVQGRIVSAMNMDPSHWSAV